MCSVMGLGLGMLSSAQSITQQSAASESQFYSELANYQRSKANWEINKLQADDTAQMRQANAILQMQQVRAAQQEANESAAEQKSEIAREMMRAKAAAELSAGEVGVSGNVVDRILTDIGFTEQSKLAAVEASRENSVNQSQSELYSIRQAAEVAPIYASLDGAPEAQSTSYLAAAVSGVSTGLGVGYTPRPTNTKRVSEPALFIKAKLRVA